MVDDSLSKEQMFEKFRNLDIDPAVGRALRAVMYATEHPHPRKLSANHHHHKQKSRNVTESPTYQGLISLADVLAHSENGENMGMFPWFYTHKPPWKFISAPFGKRKDSESHTQ